MSLLTAMAQPQRCQQGAQLSQHQSCFHSDTTANNTVVCLLIHFCIGSPAGCASAPRAAPHVLARQIDRQCGIAYEFVCCNLGLVIHKRA